MLIVAFLHCQSQAISRERHLTQPPTSMPTIIFNSHSNNFNEADGPTHCSYASSQSGIGARNRRAASRFFFLGALSFSSFSHLRFLQSLASPSSTAMRIPNRIRKRCREAADALEPAAYRLLKTWSYNLLDVEECGGMFIFAFKTSIRLLCLVLRLEWTGPEPQEEAVSPPKTTTAKPNPLPPFNKIEPQICRAQPWSPTLVPLKLGEIGRAHV